MIRAISAAITILAIAAGAAVFFSGAAPAPATAMPAKNANACKSSSYCKHGEAKLGDVVSQR